MAATVLLVEDERKLRDLVRSYLEPAGFAVLSTNPRRGAHPRLVRVPNLVVLDLGLPDVPGETVARELRLRRPDADPDAHREERGGGPGARPGTRRRRLRDQAVRPASWSSGCRPSCAAAAPRRRPSGRASFGAGTLVIDEPRRLATVRGTAVDLTPTEWGILVALATCRAGCTHRYQLINRVRGREFEGYERTSTRM